ncbi:MAG: aminodeoxychorismate/anthranilate synthase component II [Desulfobacteraceae bacterium]|nr:MAG: aminodeoxychorismate/anthranilate synthase component II [Desulfobacteraceae bacterium]
MFGWLFLFCGGGLRKLLVIDNYDSFTYNLVQMFMQYDLCITVRRNDSITIGQVKTLHSDYIVISPGPKDPANAGISIQLIKSCYQTIPILGVCLGMQCINEAFGGVTVMAHEPVHGKTSFIEHENKGLFMGVSSPFRAARYHSLLVKLNGAGLAVTARTSDGIIMGISHPVFPLHGVLFHPESFMTENGQMIIDNFLKQTVS